MDDLKSNIITRLNLNLYYLIIGVLSVIVLFVAPLFTLGEESELVFQFPKTPTAWIVYGITKAFVAVVNLLLFHCFVKQARLNVRENAKYLEATRILGVYKPKEYHPRSEREYFRKLYTSKGTTIFVTTLLGAVALTNAILSWDMSSFTTYCVTIVMGIIFGVLKMKDVEAYWTGEFYDYAKEIEKNGSKTNSDRNNNDIVLADNNSDCNTN